MAKSFMIYGLDEAKEGHEGDLKDAIEKIGVTPYPAFKILREQE